MTDGERWVHACGVAVYPELWAWEAHLSKCQLSQSASGKGADSPMTSHGESAPKLADVPALWVLPAIGGKP
jgi:hypothetical protein